MSSTEYAVNDEGDSTCHRLKASSSLTLMDTQYSSDKKTTDDCRWRSMSR
ncbi:MAG: hypothetical protein MI923_15025 [Phycisphaerales bacterium]|nr:hypothetical protein [Phycisphaerales bacterium]